MYTVYMGLCYCPRVDSWLVGYSAKATEPIVLKKNLYFGQNSCAKSGFE